MQDDDALKRMPNQFVSSIEGDLQTLMQGHYMAQSRLSKDTETS